MSITMQTGEQDEQRDPGIPSPHAFGWTSGRSVTRADPPMRGGGCPYPTNGRGGRGATGTSGRLRGRRNARVSTAKRCGSYTAARRSAPMPTVSSIALAISPWAVDLR